MMDVDVTYTLGKGGMKRDFHYSCQIPIGKIVTIYGKSGVGKTTFLRILAGLESPSTGTIRYKSEIWFDAQQGIHLSSKNRDVKMVFQENTLFPNMTVRQNLAFAKSVQTDFTYQTEVVSGLKIAGLMDLYPHQLSGGQAQRVAIGQMLMGKPNCVLLDEPLTSLDQSIRVQIQDFLKKMQLKYKMTIVLVSHDLEETIKLSDQVFLLENGVFKVQGSPLEIFGNSQTDEKMLLGKVVMVEERSAERILVYVLVGQQIIEQEHLISELDEFKIGSLVKLSLV